MNRDLSFEEAVKKAEHLKALGTTNVHLKSDSDPARPWEYATKCEPGGTVRGGIQVSVMFTAVHPCGITFQWFFDVEPWSAQGSREAQIDVDGCRRVARQLPEVPRRQFVAHLKTVAGVVRTRAGEYQREADRQFAAAAIIEGAIA